MISPYTHVTSNNVLPGQNVDRVTKEDDALFRRGLQPPTHFDLITRPFARNPLWPLNTFVARRPPTRRFAPPRVERDKRWFRLLKWWFAVYLSRSPQPGRRHGRLLKMPAHPVHESIREGRERRSSGRKRSTTYSAGVDKDLQIERNNYNRRTANIYPLGQLDLSR